MITILLLGCSEVALTGPMPHDFVDHFFDRPWPSDLRTQNGRPVLSDWQDGEAYDLLARFLELAESQPGFGTNSPIYYRFDQELDQSKFPTPEESISETSAFFLINVDTTSVGYGERIPVRWHFQVDETKWQPTNLLSVAPLWGYPLEPSTAYALVITTQIAQPTEDFPNVWNMEHDNYEHYLPLQQVLLGQDYPIEEIAHATIFTTQNPLADVIRISDWIQGAISKPRLDQRLRFVMEGNDCRIYEGKMLIPLWQHGDKPYAQEGGNFAFDVNGTPIIHSWEHTTFSLTLPNDPMPEGGWPVAIFSHGTGGDHTTFANSDSRREPATQFAKAGIVGFGISQPLHGDRNEGGNAELYSFNYLNPTSGRTVFRQGALDQVYLSEVLSTHAHEFITEAGENFTLNPEKLVYMGHSHGGEVGAMALPFMSKNIHGAVLSGTGGGLSLTLIHREAEDFNIEFLITNTMEFESDEEISSFHPIVGLVQMLAEPTDPINYAPYWNENTPWWEAKPISVFQTEGLEDEYTPPITTEALSIAAGTPIIGTAYSKLPGHDLLDLYEPSGTIKQNKTSYNGELVTVGLKQYEEHGHFAIYDDLNVARTYRLFLESAINQQIPYIE